MELKEINRQRAELGMQPIKYEQLIDTDHTVVQRNLPHVYHDGRVCQCGDCRMAAEKQDPFALNPRLLGDEDDDDWTDVPFWFAWLAWSTVVSVPIIIPTVLAQHFFHLSDPHALILQAVLAGVIGWLVTVITRWRHQSKINPYWRLSEDAERSRHEKPTVRRGGGLHRFSLTVGFRHERLDDDR